MKTLHYGLVLSFFAVSTLPLSAQSAPAPRGDSPYGDSVINYRATISDRTNIGTTTNKLGSRIERAATGEMGVGGSRSDFKYDD